MSAAIVPPERIVERPDLDAHYRVRLFEETGLFGRSRWRVEVQSLWPVSARSWASVGWRPRGSRRFRSKEKAVQASHDMLDQLADEGESLASGNGRTGP